MKWKTSKPVVSATGSDSEMQSESDMNKATVSVVHSVHLWLSQTMTWLFTQITSMPGRIENHVVCDKTVNLDQFPLATLVSADLGSTVWKFLSENSWQLASRRQSFLLNKRVQMSGARILHSHFGDRAWENISVAEDAGLKHVVTFYGYDISRLPCSFPKWKQRYRDLFASGHLFLCEGPHMRDALVNLGCPPDKVKVHHLGIQLDRIPFKRREWTPADPLRVLIAGSFFEKKGIPYALEALGRIAKKVKLEVTIIGDASEQKTSQKEKEKILSTIVKQSLAGCTTLLGYQPHTVMLRHAYKNHIFLSPSVTSRDGDTEGGAPVSIIEMSASGMPVVSSLHCDIPNVVIDGVSGLLARERDVDDLEAKLNALLDSAESWPAMGEAGRRRIEAEFSAVIQGGRLADLYEGLIG